MSYVNAPKLDAQPSHRWTRMMFTQGNLSRLGWTDGVVVSGNDEDYRISLARRPRLRSLRSACPPFTHVVME